MTDAKRDNNQVPVMLGVSNADGKTPTPIKIDPTSHTILMENGSSGTDLGGDDAARDNNQVPVMLAVSEDDGETPVPLYINPATGALLVTC